jgi:hypothetical protein
MNASITKKEREKKKEEEDSIEGGKNCTAVLLFE